MPKSEQCSALRKYPGPDGIRHRCKRLASRWSTVCCIHGGKLPLVQRKALGRAIATLLERMETGSDEEKLLAAVAILAGAQAWSPQDGRPVKSEDAQPPAAPVDG